MKNFLLTQLILLSSFFALAQAPTIQWQKSLGGSRSELCESIEQTADGGYIVAGSSGSANGDLSSYHADTLGGNAWIVKLSTTGNIQWQKQFGGPGVEIARDIHQTSDGGYIFAGYASSNGGDVSGHHGNNDCWVVKLNDTGGIRWQRCLGGSLDEIANVVKQTADGGYIVGASTNSKDGDVTSHIGPTTTRDYWVVKLDSMGTIQWQHSYGGTYFDDLMDIDEVQGGYIIAGSTMSVNVQVTGRHGDTTDSDCWIVKINNTGAMLWQHCFGGTNLDYAYSITETHDTGFLFTGYTLSSDGDVTSTNGSGDGWVVRLSSTGTILWQKCLGGSMSDGFTSVQPTLDGYIMAGFAQSADGDVSGYHGSADYWVVKLSDSGNIKWQKCLGGSGYDNAYEIYPTTDTGFIVAGQSTSTNGNVTGNHGFEDYWVVKLKESVPPNTGIITTFSSPVITLRPNPAADMVEVLGAETCIIDILSVTGTVLIHSTENEISVADLPPGLYLVKVTDNSGQVLTIQKLIKQ